MIRICVFLLKKNKLHTINETQDTNNNPKTSYVACSEWPKCINC